jgi:hypothetical protein
MLRKFAFLSAGVVAAALAATPAMAAEQTNAGPGSAAVPALGPSGSLFGPYAQAQAFISQSCQVVANKGFTAVTHPTTGVCCLTLGAGIQLSTTPLVTVEWSRSLGVALFAQYDSTNLTCPRLANVIEVRTYKGDTGGVGSALQVPVLSNLVAFFVVVP